MAKATHPKMRELVLKAVSSSPLAPRELSEQARAAATEILIAGEAVNTRRSYESAVRYWNGWSLARYGMRLPLPVPETMVIQFIVDHVGRLRGGEVVSELPAAIDQALVEAGAKGKLGPLKTSTVSQRLSVLSKLHQVRRLENPCENPKVRHLMLRARRASFKRGEAPRRVTAATLDPLKAMLDTCDSSLVGVRDRAILLFGWSSGGRRRSEVAGARVEDLVRLRADFYAFRLGHSKTDQSGEYAGKAGGEKPIRGPAAVALKAWLDLSGVKSGPLFRRLWGERVGDGLSGKSIAEVIKRRARMAGLAGDWSGHSLRSGYVTEAGRRGLPLGDVMALTGHRKIDTVMGYYRGGELGESEAGNLFGDEPGDGEC